MRSKLWGPGLLPPNTGVISFSHIIFKNMAHVGSFSQFVFVFVIVLVFVFAFVFVIVIPGASVDSTCHELSEYVWSCGSVKHGK